MRKSVDEWLVRAVMALWSGVRTMVGHEEVRCGGVAGIVEAVMALYSGVRTMDEWAMRKSGVEEWLVQAVMALYSGVRTMVGHEEVRCGGVAGTSGDGSENHGGP